MAEQWSRTETQRTDDGVIAELKKAREEVLLLADGFEYYKNLAGKREAEVAHLREQMRLLMENAASPVIAPKTASTQKSLHTLLKLVGVMAMAGYGYNPSLKKGDSVAQIQNDLNQRGLHLDADTIRKWLKESAKLVLAAESNSRPEMTNQEVAKDEKDSGTRMQKVCMGVFLCIRRQVWELKGYVSSLSRVELM